MDVVTEKFKNFLRSGKNKNDIRNLKQKLTIATQKLMHSSAFHKKSTALGHFQVIDFFSGAGGMSSGFFALSKIIPGSFQLIGGCDINEEALESYSKNYAAPGVVGDIRTLSKSGELDKFLKTIKYDSKRPLVLIGCAPCQGFTSHRKKNWDKLDDRNDLATVFAKVAVRLNPECVIMENVPEMFSDKYKNYYESAIRIFEKSGYTIHQKVYNTAAFGVPQERRRLLCVAMKKDFLLPVELVDESNFKTVRDAIGDLPPISPGVPYLRDAYHVCAKHKPETIEVIKAVAINGGNRPVGIGPKCLDRVKGFTDVYGRLYWDRPAITITQYARNPASGRYVHPEQHRGLSVREAARLQSFPDEYIFAGKFDSMFKQIGEAVPPNFSCAVAASVFIELISDTNRLTPRGGRDNHGVRQAPGSRLRIHPVMKKPVKI